MHVVRVYVDTSVFGGIADEEFGAASRRFFERMRRGELIAVVSAEVVRELATAPQSVRDQLDGLPRESLEAVAVTAEIEALADAYVAAGILGQSSRSDALHVAAATVSGADLIVSWNFRHIVNYDRIGKYNAVNVLKGYEPIEIRSPAEVAYGDQTESV